LRKTNSLKASGQRRSIPFTLLLATQLIAVACDNPTGPSAGPAISCPASVTVPSPTGNAVPVTYAAPQVTGGKAPVTTTCTPPSGSTFPIGSTAVSCTATDADRRVAACSFLATVAAPPRLTATRFTAFGDSITHGILSTCPIGAAPYTFASYLRELQHLAVHGDDSASYPRKLRGLLGARYTAQNPTVANEGFPGETVERGIARLRAVLAANAPQVLLLQEGINELNFLQLGAIPAIREGLRTMIRDARGRGIEVFLGTLLPQRPGACRYFASPPVIEAANSELRSLAVAEGAALVDLYVAFAGQVNALLGPDGLHPNEAGYERIAQTFFDLIRQRLEAASSTLTGGLSGSGPSYAEAH
jgi:lysophospholipase L1-like esterase